MEYSIGFDGPFKIGKKRIMKALDDEEPSDDHQILTTYVYLYTSIPLSAHKLKSKEKRIFF